MALIKDPMVTFSKEVPFQMVALSNSDYLARGLSLGFYLASFYDFATSFTSSLVECYFLDKIFEPAFGSDVVPIFVILFKNSEH